ncbi:MAG TPA: 4a-hydroxytetrahydrobiopterin dehydratase [Casimicrobiaceae bacterium]|nr:4a-hydroxytetrahydrobiopterin dehydratase [Casimicrobiaceae bacterium]
MSTPRKTSKGPDVRAALAALAAQDCRPGAPLLPRGDLARELAALPGWKHARKALNKTFAFADYYRTMAFVNAVAFVAHRQDHHPDLSVHYNRVDVVYSTHDAGGVTLNDCICAAKVESLAGSP